MKIRYSLVTGEAFVTESYPYIMISTDEDDPTYLFFRILGECDCDLLCEDCHDSDCGCVTESACCIGANGEQLDECQGTCRDHCSCETFECEENHEFTASPNIATMGRHAVGQLYGYQLAEMELMHSDVPQKALAKLG